MKLATSIAVALGLVFAVGCTTRPHEESTSTRSATTVSPACEADDDCTVGARCMNGSCETAKTCASSDECPTGAECINRECAGLGTACAYESDCPAALTCAYGACDER